MKATEQKHPTPQPTAEQTDNALDKAIAATVARRESAMRSSAAFLGIPQADLYQAMRGIWTTTKGQDPLTDAEIWLGLRLVGRYELDPFAREIYVTRGKDGPMIIVGVDGWVRLLNRNPDYDGFETALIEDDEGNVTAAETTIYSRSRSHPTTYMALASEYANLAGFMHATIPTHMLRIFSLRHAARLFMPLGGVVTEEEMQWMTETKPGPPVNSLDELTERLTTPEKPAVAATEEARGLVIKAEARTKERDEAVGRQERYARWLAEATTVDKVSGLREDIVAEVADKRLTEEQAGELYELANAAEERIAKT